MTANLTKRKAPTWRPTIELLEDRATPTVSWSNFNGDQQHTGISTVAAQTMDHIVWQTPIDAYGAYFLHFGEPVFTPANTAMIPVKLTGSGQEDGYNFQVQGRNGNTGALLWTANSDYVEPSYDWLPPYQPVYDSVTNRVYFAGNGGTLYYVSNPDNPGSATPTPVQLAFYGIANYNANPGDYNSVIYINTPLTVDNSGNVYFGFTVTGSNPSGINDGGIARISAAGVGSYVLTGTAVGVGTGSPALGSAPALNSDGSILYAAMVDSNGGSYLVGVNAATLAPEYSVNLSLPNGNTGVYLINESSASPMVAPDGSVFMGVFANAYNGSRGFMLHYSANLGTEYTPGAFGWDDTASIVPTSMVPSYTGSSPYLILTKYNNYVAAETGYYGGDGVNKIAVLDPFATQTDPNNDPNPNMLVMKEVMTITSPTSDDDYVGSGYPNATNEWCTNGTVIDPATDSVFINNEDGYAYRWNLATGTLTQAVEITDGVGEPYTPTAIGPNGMIYAINGGSLFALGSYSNYSLTNVSSLNPAVAGQPVTFTTTVAPTISGPVPTGIITYTYTSGTGTPDDSTPQLLGTATLVNGQATFTTSALLPAHYHLIASYGGDVLDGYAAGSTTLVQTVLETTTTGLITSGSPVLANQSVTFTATVTPTGTAFVPIGTVSFYNGATLLGTVKLGSNDQAAFTTSTLPTGSNSITAVYSGDQNFAGSTSSVLVQGVGMAPAVSSVLVNGGAPAYLDSNGLAVSLAGQNSVVEQILVTFNEAVTLDANAFTITNNAGNVTVLGGPAPNTLPVNAIQTPVGGSPSAQWIVTFSGPGTNPIPGGLGNVIKDGVYYLNVIGSKVHANAQTAASQSTGFWALYGSAYAPDNTLSGTIGDGGSEVVVDAPDYSLFKAAFGSESDLPGGADQPYYNVSMDANLDGIVDATDFSKFKNNFGADWMF
jgi:Bacterial Ig-like domain (group 3)